MEIDILSLFPGYFQGPFSVSLLKKAQERGLITLRLVDIRDFGIGKHRRVDDRPFGGGHGMVMMAEPIMKAIRSVRKEGSHVIYLSPQGASLNAKRCQEFAKYSHVILLCGHYEGIDQRVIEKEVDEEIRIGECVLTSGCPAAAVFVDGVARFIPGVVGNSDSVLKDTFQEGKLAPPQYTQPKVVEGMEVPALLREGNHAHIEKWREKQAKEKAQNVVQKEIK